MIIKQLSIFLENKSGRLTEVLKTLSAEKIDVKALTVADTSEFGILRLLVSKPEQAYILLKEKGFSVNLTDVLGIATPREAGSFAHAMSLLSDKNISIEYVYAFSIGEKAVIVMRTDDIEKAIRAIRENNMELLDAGEFNNL
jgi:hypothetical protein